MSKCKTNDENIPKSSYVRVTEMNHIVEVQYMQKMNRKITTRKLDANHYVNIESGEIFEYEHNDNRSENLNSLRKTFKSLRYLINNNFSGESNELHLTLTYKENMQDIERLYDDFRKFIMRLRYRFKDKTTIDYISVVEPQERGAWHCHVLMRFNDISRIYIENDVLRQIWGHGFVVVKSLRNVDNIGAYLSAYLSDVVLDDDNINIAFKDDTEVIEKEIDGVSKKVIKGGRLYMYPIGMNLYRKSKGIKPPERKDMIYENVKKIVGSAKPNYSKSFNIKNDNFENKIIYEQYNLKRDK